MPRQANPDPRYSDPAWANDFFQTEGHTILTFYKVSSAFPVEPGPFQPFQGEHSFPSPGIQGVGEASPLPCTFLTRKLPSLEFNVSCSQLHLVAQENTPSLHFQPLTQYLISRHRFQRVGPPSRVV